MEEKKKTVKKRNALGRGLGALLDSDHLDETPRLATDAADRGIINDIPVKFVMPNPFQPRMEFDQESLEELAESIRIQGIIQPITVRKLSSTEYQLISGERRLKATRLAGINRIPAYIREANDQQMIEMALIDNIQRENLNAIEIAQSYQRLITECSLKQEELGDRVGKKRTTVANYLRLLKLPPDIQTAIKSDKISMGHARALINIDNIDVQLSVFKKIVKDDLSVRKVEELVRKISDVKISDPNPIQHNDAPIELKQLQTELSSFFGTKVEVNHRGGEKGEIKIPYLSHDDLNRILDILELRM